MGLGTGLTGVASSVSPTAPDGFGLFLGSHGAAFAFTLSAGPLGFVEASEDVGYILDSLFFLENSRIILSSVLTAPYFLSREFENHLVLSPSFDVPSDDTAENLIGHLHISFVETIVHVHIIRHQAGNPYLSPK